MVKPLVFLACLIAGQVSAATWRPTDRLLLAVRYVESNHGRYTWGDNGRSLGEYQLSEAAWADVTLWRKSRRMATFTYRRHVWDPTISRAYAADYLSLLHTGLTKRLRRPPNAVEVYAAYNLGLTGFAQCQYELAKVNSTTARKCHEIKAMMARN